MSKKTTWQQPSLEEQAAKLTEMFYGNEHFENVRGKLAGDFLTVACRPLYNKENVLKSRTKGAQDTRNFFNSFAWVQEHIGVLERIGMHQAATEIKTALLQPDYRILGEAELLSTLVPMTAIIFEAPLTLCVLNKSIHENCFKTRDIPIKVRKKLLFSYEFRAAEKLIHHRTIFEGLERLYDPFREILKQHLQGQWQAYRYSCVKLPVSPEENKNRKKYVFGGIIHLVRAKREEVLQLLTPEQQKKTASWEFELPEAFFQSAKT